MKLIENEKMLMKNTTGEMTLTNFRVIKSKINGGVTIYTSMPLEKISSVQFRSHNYKWLLYGGLFICLIGIFAGLNSQDSMPMITGGCLFGGLFIAAYFLMRIQILEICSIGGDRIQSVTNEKFESAFQFIHAIEHVAKTGNIPASGESIEVKTKTA